MKPFSNRLCALALVALLGSGAGADPLTTLAEQSGYQRTGRYAEVERLCAAFASHWPEAVRCENFGRTPEGRPMLALVASQAGALTPETAKAAGLPVVLLQGGIHAGEIDGKDAGFLALREMLENRAAPSALEKVTLVFVPVFNVDGHERFGAWNRPNQVGPAEMGWRVTSQNLNLNRDYAKADSPEMAAMLGLLNRWDPILYVDLHVTDGAHFQPDIATLVEPIFIGEPALQPLGKKLQKDTNERLRAQGSLPLDFYPSLRDHRDPASGFSDGAYTPRFSTGYWALRNRLAMLVETHSWKPYPTRVGSTRNAIVALAELTARDGQEWLAAAARADKTSAALAGTSVPLAFKTTDRHRMIDFPGVAYSHQRSAISGIEELRYQPDKPQIWHIPFYDEVVPTLQVKAPGAGYLVPAAHASWMAQRLQLHGILLQTLQNPLAEQPLGVFRATQVDLAKRSSEGHMMATLRGEWSQETQALAPGALFIPIAQPKARLVMALLEPMAPDSFAAWGFFNAHFEPKEYMEEYVADEVGRQMLASHPDVAAEFQRRLASDPQFARDPEARLDFFYRRHPSWDQRLNLYPVLRTDRCPDF